MRYHDRQLCILLNAEDIYKALARILQQERNLRFVATMVDVLNTILLTSAELYDLRLQLRNFNKPVSHYHLPLLAAVACTFHLNTRKSICCYCTL